MELQETQMQKTGKNISDLNHILDFIDLHNLSITIRILVFFYITHEENHLSDDFKKSLEELGMFLESVDQIR